MLFFLWRFFLHVIVVLVFLVFKLWDDLNHSLLVLSHLFHELVFGVLTTTFYVVQMMDDDVFDVTKILDDLNDVEVLDHFFFTKLHDTINFLNHRLIFLSFEETKAWYSIVSVIHASFLLVHFILRQSLVWILRVCVWLLKNVTVVRPNQEELAESFHHEYLSWKLTYEDTPEASDDRCGASKCTDEINETIDSSGMADL